MIGGMPIPAKNAEPAEVERYLSEVPREERLRAMAKLTPRQLVEVVFAWMLNRKPENAQKLAGHAGVYRFELEDFRDGVWTIEVVAGRFVVRQGEPARVDFGVAMHIDDFEDIQRGEVEPKRAFMAGKIKTQGDMGAAMRLGMLLYGDKIQKLIR
jgi:putative sterol carrier protein